MGSPITDHLNEAVYPALNAVESGLLDEYAPSPIQRSGSHILKCPRCSKKEAFYYPFSPVVNCPRGLECGESTSIWDAISNNYPSNGEIYKALCESASVAPLSNDEEYMPALWRTVMDACQYSITDPKHSDTVNAYLKLKSLSLDSLKTWRYGLYPSTPYMRAVIRNKGFTDEEAILKGFIPDPAKTTNDPWRNRIVSFWRQPDGSHAMIGRAPEGVKPKYYFQPGIKKTIPYRFHDRVKGPLILVEGVTDADSLRFGDIYGCGLGGKCLTSEQAIFLLRNKCYEAIHLIDADTAGYKGALSTIRNGESAGITLSIATLPAGSDDPDTLRQKKKGSVIERSIDCAVNAGEFLAMMVAKELCDSHVCNGRSLNQFKTIAETLTPISHAHWLRACRELGVPLDNTPGALSLMSTLILNGLSSDEAETLVSQRFGLTIRISTSESSPNE